MPRADVLLPALWGLSGAPCAHACSSARQGWPHPGEVASSVCTGHVMGGHWGGLQRARQTATARECQSTALNPAGARKDPNLRDLLVWGGEAIIVRPTLRQGPQRNSLNRKNKEH